MNSLYKNIKQIERPIIGMVHIAALPGSVYFDGSYKNVCDRAVNEATIIAESGFDAVLIQNTGDVPTSHEGDEAVVAFMTAIGLKIKEKCQIPVGINVLMNGSKAALAIAKAIDADFVRIKVAVGAVVSSTGILNADPHGFLKFKRDISAESITIFADLYDRTSSPVGNMPIEVLADLAIRHGGADGLILSGFNYQDTLDRLITVRQAIKDAYLIAGGFVNDDNLETFFNVSNAVIVGSSIKTGGHFLDPLDPQKTQAMVNQAMKLRQRLIKG
jgi:uncharacterized protein